MRKFTVIISICMLCLVSTGIMQATVYTVTTEANEGEGSFRSMAGKLSEDGDVLTFADSVREIRLNSYLRIESAQNKSYIIIGKGVTIYSDKNIEFGFGTAKFLSALTVEDLHFNTKSYIAFAVANLSVRNCTFLSEDGVRSELRLEANMLNVMNTAEFSGCAFIGRGKGQRRINMDIRSNPQQTSQQAHFVSCTFINGEHSNSTGNVFHPRYKDNNLPEFKTLVLTNCVIIDRKGSLSINMPKVISNGYNVIQGYVNGAGRDTVPEWRLVTDEYVSPADSVEIIKYSAGVYQVVYNGGNGKAYRRLRAAPEAVMQNVPFPAKDLSGKVIDYTRPTHSGAWQSVYLTDRETEATGTVAATGITVSNDRDVFTEQTFTAVASVQPVTAAQDVRWMSSDTTIATVDASGLVTVLPASAASDTTVIITAITTSAKDSSGGYLSASMTVTVKPFLHVTGISIDSSSLNARFVYGYTREVKAEIIPMNANNRALTWTVEPKGIVDIVNISGQNGSTLTVKAISSGRAVITVTSDDGGLEASCTATVVDADYTSGMFVVNEDWFGHSNSSVNYLYPDGQWDLRVLDAVNGVNVTGVTTQFGAIYGGRFYLVSKHGTRLGIADARTLRHEKSFTNIGGGEGRSFIGVDEKTGYLATSTGIKVIDLEAMFSSGNVATSTLPHTVINMPEGNIPQGEHIGSMERAGEYVFAIMHNSGIAVINASTHSVEKILSAYKYHSLTLAMDGYVYAGTSKASTSAWNGLPGMESNGIIVRIDPWTLSETPVTLPQGYEGPQPVSGAWQCPPVWAGTTENVIYWKTGSRIVCYHIDHNMFSTVIDLSGYRRHPEPAADPYSFYGTAFRVHPSTGMIYAVVGTFASLGGNIAHRNHWKVIKVNPKGGRPSADANGDIGNIVEEYPLPDHYWFPAMPVFPDIHAPAFTSIPFPEICLDGSHTSDSLCFSNRIMDADNITPSITATVLNGYDTSLIGARIWRDTLIVSLIKPIPEGSPSGHTTVRLKFNSNGHVITKDIKVTVKAAVAVTPEPVDTVPTPAPVPPPLPEIDLMDVTVDNVKENEASLYFPATTDAGYYLVHLYRRQGLTLQSVFTLKVNTKGAVTLRATSGNGFIVPLTYLHSGTSYFADIESIVETDGKEEVIHRQTIAFTTKGIASGTESSDQLSPQARYANRNLYLSNLNGCHVRLYAPNGNIVANFKVTDVEAHYPLSLPHGVYILVAERNGTGKAFKIYSH